MKNNHLATYPKADHTLSIIHTPSRPYLSWLANGPKKAEGRVNGPACQKMQVGDTILLHDKRSPQYLYGSLLSKMNTVRLKPCCLPKSKPHAPFFKGRSGGGRSENLQSFSWSFPGKDIRLRGHWHKSYSF